MFLCDFVAEKSDKDVEIIMQIGDYYEMKGTCLHDL